jgi:hypothetical protein
MKKSSPDKKKGRLCSYNYCCDAGGGGGARRRGAAAAAGRCGGDEGSIPPNATS